MRLNRAPISIGAPIPSLFWMLHSRVTKKPCCLSHSSTRHSPSRPLRAADEPSTYKAECSERFAEARQLAAEVKKRLPLQWRFAFAAVRVYKPNAPLGKAQQPSMCLGLVKPLRIRRIVGQHDGLRNTLRRIFRHHLLDELRHQRLGIRRVEPHAAMPGLRQPVILGGIETRGVDSFLCQRVTCRVEVDTAHDGAGCLHILRGRNHSLSPVAFARWCSAGARSALR